jgi:cobalt/nickel transport system permease protein
LRHVTVDDWSTRDGVLHRRDARAKIIALLAVLIAISVSSKPPVFVAVAGFLAVAVAFSRAPLGGFTARVAVLLVFPLIFAVLIAFSGDTDRALLLLIRSGLSITAVLITIATTPTPRLLTALLWFGLPSMLVEVVQFVYRYLFVLGEEAWHMRTAAALRGGGRSVPAAASTVGVLFGRAYGRAEGIHRSIASRSFSGLMSAPSRGRFRPSDAVFALVAVFAAVACIVYERLA